MTDRLSTRIWLSLLLLAAATLGFEINLTRLFSVSQFYHLAFMIVSIALLGFGASGSALAIFPRLRLGTAQQLLARCSLGTALGMLVSFLTVNWLPFDSFSIAWDPRQSLVLALHYLALAVPFFFSGLAVGSLLSAFVPVAGKVYAANLIGSGAGCMLALALPSWLGVEGSLILYAAMAGIAAIASRPPWRHGWKGSSAIALCLTVLALAYVTYRGTSGVGLGAFTLRLSPYKALSYALQAPGSRVLYTRWNAFSRIDVVGGGPVHSVPGLSYRYLQTPPAMDALFVDGDDQSPVVDMGADSAFVDYLPTAVALHLRPEGRAVILGPRGGLDALVALRLNLGSTTVVEANPLIARVAPIYADSRLEVITGSERGFLRRTDSEFDVIVLSLQSGYHPVQSGAYALGEDYRYTIEGFVDAIDRLAPGGVFIASRWLQDPPSEDLRLFALMAAALELSGGDVGTQLVAFRGFNMGTVMLKNGPYSAAELEVVRRFLDQRAFDLSYAPDIQSSESNQFNVLKSPVYYQTYLELVNAGSSAGFFETHEYDVRPPTDDRPFFGHYFKWRQAPQVASAFGKAWLPFGGAGYFVIAALLFLATLLAAVLILLPVRLQARAPGNRRPSYLVRDLLYFALIGFAYLFVEMPLLQLFILYLEQPAYAAAIVLFGLLVFSGFGSQLARFAPLRRTLLILAGLAVVEPFLIRLVIEGTLALPLWSRMITTVGLLAPLGLLMGVPFPGRILERSAQAAGPPGVNSDLSIPWIWAVNGAASVVASILAALLALTFGFSVVLSMGAACYAAALIVAAWRSQPSRSRIR